MHIDNSWHINAFFHTWGNPKLGYDMQTIDHYFEPRSALSIHLSLEILTAFGQVKPLGLAWQPSRHTKTCFSLRLHFYRWNLKFPFDSSIMEQPSSSRPGPQRSASALSAHRVSPYSSRSSSAGPLCENLAFIRKLLNEIAASQELNLDVFPPPTDQELRSLSTCETILLPIVGAVLANVIETSTKVDKLTATVEALISPASRDRKSVV